MAVSGVQSHNVSTIQVQMVNPWLRAIFNCIRCCMP